jgi:hypothetical protein
MPKRRREEAEPLVAQEVRDHPWWLSAVEGMSLKRIAKQSKVKKMEVFEGIRRHQEYREQKQWVKKMQEKYPPPAPSPK